MELEFTHPNPGGAGLKITITLDPEEDRRLGIDSGPMVDHLSDVLLALVSLRIGAVDPTTANCAITSIRRLTDSMTGVSDALVRGWVGSIGDLASAMDVPSRSTAQSRRNAVLSHPPTPAEQWATGPTTPVVMHLCQHPHGHCPRLGTHMIYIDDIPTDVPICAGHIADAITRYTDRDLTYIEVHRLAPAGVEE